MAGEQQDPQAQAADTQVDAQALWNDVAAERDIVPADTTVFTGQPIPEEPELQKEEPAAAKQATQPAIPEDPFAGLSPAVVERLKALDTLQAQVSAVPALQRQVAEAQGRVAAMQRELQTARDAAKAVDQAPTATQIAAASKTPEKWASLKSDFPEWADATEEFVKASLAGLQSPKPAAPGITPEEVEDRIQSRVSNALAQAEARMELEKVTDRHPGWQTTVRGAEFKQWVAVQDQTTQALAASAKARDAIAMLDLFQRAKAAPADMVAQERQERLAAAVTTRPAAGTKPGGKSPDQMTAAELWEHERKQATKRNTAHGLTY